MEGIGGSNAVSAAFSYISLICWIFVYTPQLWKNYKLKSNAAEAISMGFLVSWLIGDMFYIIAAICKVFFLKNLGISVLAIGIWYAVADLMLIFQTVYYRKNYTVTVMQEAKLAPEEPCLQTETQFEATLHSASHSPVHPHDVLNVEKPVGEEERLTLHSAMALPFFLFYTVAVALASPARRIIPGETEVVVTDTEDPMYYTGPDAMNGLHFPNSPIHVSQPAESIKGPHDWRHGISVLAQVCAWLAFVCFIGARLPQLYKNYVNKTAGGLSLGMFGLCVIGNVTLLIHFATSAEGIFAHISFFATSIGCLVFDSAIGLQTILYRRKAAKEARLLEDFQKSQLKTVDF